MINNSTIFTYIAELNQLQIQLLCQYHECSEYLILFLRERSALTKRLTPQMAAYSILMHDYQVLLRQCNHYLRECSRSIHLTDELAATGNELQQQCSRMNLKCLRLIKKMRRF